MSKRTCAVIAGLLLSGAICAQDSSGINERITLKQCIEMALDHNLQVRQNELQAQTNEIGVQQAKANLLPSLNANGSQGMNSGKSIDPFTNNYVDQNVSYGNYNLVSGVTLFSGFVLQNSIRQNALIYEASKMDLQQSKDNLTLSVLLAYLQVLSNEDLLVIAREQAAVTREQQQRLEILNRDGAIAPSALYDVKGQYASDQLNLVNAQSALDNARLNLFQQMNVPYRRNVQMERLPLDTSMNMYGVTSDSIYHTALEKLALVKAANLRIQSAEKGVKVAQSQLYPTLSLSGSLNSNYSSAATTSTILNTTDIATQNYILINGNKNFLFTPQSTFSFSKVPYTDQVSNNFNTSISLGLHVPIFNSFQVKNRIKLAKIQLRNNELVAQSTRVQLQQSVEQAYQNMLAAYSRYQASIEQVAAYQVSFRAAEIRFNAGASTSVDYIIAKNNIDRANINLTANKYDYIFRTKILDFYQDKALW